MSNEVLDEASVVDKFGVTPERMLDYLMLIGDTADNVPGVHKVGPKTAVKWLTQYGSLDNIIAHADDFKGAIGDNLRKALDWFDTARQLITIKCDVDLPVRITDLAPKPQDTGKLILLYEQLDMKASLRELRQQQSNLNQSESVGSNENLAVSAADNGNKDAVQTHSGTYQTIFTEDELNDWLIRLDAAQLVSVDSETTSLSPMQAKLVGISFCIENHQAAYLPLMHNYTGVPKQLPLDEALSKLKPWLENSQKSKFCLLYTSPSPRDGLLSRMPSSA